MEENKSQAVESRVRLDTGDIGDWFAPGGSAFLFDVYVTHVFLNAGAERLAQAMHLKVSAKDVRQAAGLADKHLRDSGTVREGEVLNVVEAFIDCNPAENDVPIGSVEVVATKSLKL